MLYRDPKCVFVASTMGQAHIVAGWLQEHGITAEVMNPVTMGGWGPALEAATGVEVWILNPAQAPEAILLLGEHALELVTKPQAGPPLDVVCEECGKSSTFPARQRGTVQSCPHCSAYLDVEPTDGTERFKRYPDSDDNEDPGTDRITEKGPRDITR